MRIKEKYNPYNYIYVVTAEDGYIYRTVERGDALEWYKRNNGIRIETITKNLYPTRRTIANKPNVDINNIRLDGDILNRTSVKRRKQIAKYQDEFIRQIKFNFNIKTDKDILEYLDKCDNKQGLVKKLLRSKIAKEEAKIKLREKRRKGKEHIKVINYYERVNASIRADS